MRAWESLNTWSIESTKMKESSESDINKIDSDISNSKMMISREEYDKRKEEMSEWDLMEWINTAMWINDNVERGPNLENFDNITWKISKEGAESRKEFLFNWKKCILDLKEQKFYLEWKEFELDTKVNEVTFKWTEWVTLNVTWAWINKDFTKDELSKQFNKIVWWTMLASNN